MLLGNCSHERQYFTAFPTPTRNSTGLPSLALAVKPVFHGEDRFEGIVRHGLVHKLSLYADDLLLYISVPLSSLPKILSILNNFGQLSGYKVNLQKLFWLNYGQSSGCASWVHTEIPSSKS